MYHTDNRFTYTLQYITVSTNILITSYICVFLSFQDGDIPHHSYRNIRYTLELITKILSVFYFLKYILKLSILRLRTGFKTFVIYPLYCTSLRMATSVAETCMRHTKFVIYEILLNVYMYLLVSLSYLIHQPPVSPNDRFILTDLHRVILQKTGLISTSRGNLKTWETPMFARHQLQ